MADVLLFTVMVTGGACLTVALLAWRDTRHQRRQEEQRPVSERIKDIRENAAFMVGQLRQLLERESARRPETVTWVGPPVEYYRRLEALASAPAPSAAEALRLAEEASQHVRASRVKGILVAEQARKLATLARRREAV